MQEIIQQYGRTILVITLTASLLSFLFSNNGSKSIYRQLSEHLVKEMPSVSNDSEDLSADIFSKASTKICPNTDLTAKMAYSVPDVVRPVFSETQTIVGGKILAVSKLYDGPDNTICNTDVTSECLLSNGQKVQFPCRGLYRLTVSVHDNASRDALQYIYIPIEGSL